jgi:hypothetical protein
MTRRYGSDDVRSVTAIPSNVPTNMARRRDFETAGARRADPPSPDQGPRAVLPCPKSSLRDCIRVRGRSASRGSKSKFWWVDRQDGLRMRSQLSPVADMSHHTPWSAMGQDLPPALQKTNAGGLSDSLIPAHRHRVVLRDALTVGIRDPETFLAGAMPWSARAGPYRRDRDAVPGLCAAGRHRDLRDGSPVDCKGVRMPCRCYAETWRISTLPTIHGKT